MPWALLFSHTEEPPVEDPSSCPKTSSPKTLANRASTHICTPPSASTGPKGWNTPQSPKCNGHVHPNKKRLPSTTKSQQLFKADAAQIQEVAGDGEGKALGISQPSQA